MRGVAFKVPALYASRSGERLDVEADVIENERLPRLGKDGFGERLAFLLGQLREQRSQGDRRGEGQGILRLHRLGLQPAADLGEAGVAQPRLGLLRPGEVPE